MTLKNFAIVGGDKRNVALAEMLFRQGHRVKMFGFTNYEQEIPSKCKNLHETINDADVVIGPTPFTHNSGILNMPFQNEPVLCEDLFKLIKPAQALIAGYVRPDIFELAKKFDIQIIDMLKREELLVLNAIPTAEGAIKIAIEETDVTLHGNNMLVIGYGRIGTALSKMLSGIGARVVVVVNSSHKMALVNSFGHGAIMYDDLDMYLKDADIIFNTVPKILLNRQNMKHINKNTLIIDLASPPYGVDVDAARDLGLKTLFTNSLPGKIAPVTTARYIFETITNIIAEGGAS